MLSFLPYEQGLVINSRGSCFLQVVGYWHNTAVSCDCRADLRDPFAVHGEVVRVEQVAIAIDACAEDIAALIFLYFSFPA
jgi:hypothetical protein